MDNKFIEDFKNFFNSKEDVKNLEAFFAKNRKKVEQNRIDNINKTTSKYAKYNHLINTTDSRDSIITSIQKLDKTLSYKGISCYVDRVRKKLNKNSSKFVETNNTTMNIISPSKYLEKSVLVIPDLHEPFNLEGFLEHCIQVRKKFKCKHIIFIGDLIDNSASSYHELNPNGFSASEELDLAITNIQKWYKAFPEAVVINGNHCCLPQRLAKTSGLDRRWIQANKDVLQVPNWEFKDSHLLHNILYVHGHQHKEAFNECLIQQVPVVSGHRHTKCYVKYQTNKLWGMQVGIGFDKSKYAFDYARGNVNQCVENVGVIFDGVPILQPFYRI